jgi:hypothetical protein
MRLVAPLEAQIMKLEAELQASRKREKALREALEEIAAGQPSLHAQNIAIETLVGLDPPQAPALENDPDCLQAG